ncbi:glycine betaine ABC transporter substrate-binding protein [Syntrophomonas erecta subsp. sporosyntropha]
MLNNKFIKIFTITVLLSIMSVFVMGCGGGQTIDQKGDAQAIDKWVLATNHEFSVRPDGYPELKKVYDFKFDDVQVMDLGVTYGALQNDKVPVALGFATDGRIAAFGLVNLKDDKSFFPVYNPAPVIRQEVLESHPELKEILAPISKKLDTATMTDLNKQVDVDDKKPEAVAREWLLKEGLIEEKNPPADKGTIRVGSKEFTEQLLLGAITIKVLENEGFKVEDHTGLNGSLVVRTALEENEIDLYWEYTGTAWLTYMGNEEAITDPEECYQKVKQADAKKGLVWLDYAPFDNTYTLMMRKTDAEAYNIETLSDLAEVIKANK